MLWSKLCFPLGQCFNRHHLHTDSFAVPKSVKSVNFILLSVTFLRFFGPCGTLYLHIINYIVHSFDTSMCRRDTELVPKINIRVDAVACFPLAICFWQDGVLFHHWTEAKRFKKLFTAFLLWLFCLWYNWELKGRRNQFHYSKVMLKEPDAEESQNQMESWNKYYIWFILSLLLMHWFFQITFEVSALFADLHLVMSNKLNPLSINFLLHKLSSPIH